MTEETAMTPRAAGADDQPAVTLSLEPFARLIIVDRFFYCRHCEEYTYRNCKLRQHRSGLFFRGVIELELSEEKKVYFDVIFGTGEWEHGAPEWLQSALGKVIRSSSLGTKDFEHGHKTVGGWYELHGTVIRELSPEEGQRLIKEAAVDLNNDELIDLADNLARRYIKLLTAIDSVREIEKLPIELMKFMPVLYAFRSDAVRVISHKPLVTITNIRQSFTAKIYAKVLDHELTVKIPKKNYRVEEEDLNTNTRGYLLFPPKDTEPLAAVSIRPDNVAVYKAFDSYSDGVVRYYVYDAFEVSATQTHARATVSATKVEFSLYLTHRLGDVVFAPESYKERVLLPELGEDALKKVRIHGGELNENILTVKDVAYIYHPEHGVLMLPQGTYYLHSVRYTWRGHD